MISRWSFLGYVRFVFLLALPFGILAGLVAAFTNGSHKLGAIFMAVITTIASFFY